MLFVYTTRATKIGQLLLIMINLSIACVRTAFEKKEEKKKREQKQTHENDEGIKEKCKSK